MALLEVVPSEESFELVSLRRTQLDYERAGSPHLEPPWIKL
jgi:hypothetical protein